jgi:N-acetylneuraminic acid mutarotase
MRAVVVNTLAALSLCWGQTSMWKEMSPMPEPRAGYVAGAIDRRFVLAGGTYWHADKKIWSNRTDFFDPVANQWTAGPDLPSALGDAAAISYNGKMYVFGGGAEGAVVKSALVFNGSKWSAAPEWDLPARRIYPVATVMAGRVFIAGGLTKAGDIAHAETTMWSRSLSKPEKDWKTHAAIPSPRRSNFALAAANGKIFLFGGVTETDSGYTNLDDAFEYDPAADRWKALPRLPVARRAWFALEVAGRIRLYGGYTNTFEKDIFRIDLATGAASLDGSLLNGVADARFVLIGDTVISAGGESGPKIRAPWTIVTKVAR